MIANLKIEGSGLQVGAINYVPHEFRNLVLGASSKSKQLKEG